MKKLFNFYLEDDDKIQAELKLTKLLGKENKGQLASMIRVMIKTFIMMPDEKVSKEFLSSIKDEYILTTKKNKRSRL